MENILNNLNTFLSDLNVFYRKLQNYHWNVKGKDFFQAHAKLEELYGYINEAVDEVAENLLMLNAKPFASLRDFLDNADIEEAKMEQVKSKYIYCNSALFVAFYHEKIFLEVLHTPPEFVR